MLVIFVYCLKFQLLNVYKLKTKFLIEHVIGSDIYCLILLFLQEEYLFEELRTFLGLKRQKHLVKSNLDI